MRAHITARPHPGAQPHAAQRSAQGRVPTAVPTTSCSGDPPPLTQQGPPTTRRAPSQPPRPRPTPKAIPVPRAGRGDAAVAARCHPSHPSHPSAGFARRRHPTASPKATRKRRRGHPTSPPSPTSPPPPRVAAGWAHRSPGACARVAGRCSGRGREGCRVLLCELGPAPRCTSARIPPQKESTPTPRVTHLPAPLPRTHTALTLLQPTPTRNGARGNPDPPFLPPPPPPSQRRKFPGVPARLAPHRSHPLPIAAVAPCSSRPSRRPGAGRWVPAAHCRPRPGAGLPPQGWARCGVPRPVPGPLRMPVLLCTIASPDCARPMGAAVPP